MYEWIYYGNNAKTDQFERGLFLVHTHFFTVNRRDTLQTGNEIIFKITNTNKQVFEIILNYDIKWHSKIKYHKLNS